MNRVKVLVKLRPRTSDEVKLNLKEHRSIGKMVKSFDFEHIFGPTSTNSDVYVAISPMVERCKMGFNATVLSYGQKSSGKTYTMMGNDNDPGVTILAIHQLFKENQPPFKKHFIIRVGFIEIFNETMYDLLNRRQTVHFGDNGGTDIKTSNKEVVITDKETIFKLLEKGIGAKTPRSKADAPSSSHTIFQIIIESQDQTVDNAPVKISYLNLVDLDRSEGVQVKSEKGEYFDKSLKYLGFAIKALSKGQKFRSHSKSKLTRLLKMAENANTAIICHVTPTSLNQSNITLNFANEAKRVKTKATCNTVSSDGTIIKRVRADIARLQQLKVELEPLLLNASKIDDEIADLSAIFLLERNMRPQGHMKQEINQILKIRPFFNSVTGMQKKYQIGEMMDKSVDALSRSQRKSNAFKWADFYLERVGFELSLDMRRHLKYGKNIIGRSNVDSDVDISVDSLECSRKHCSIIVSDDLTVTLKDLNSSNGTIINGIKYKDKTVEFHEGDVVSIVGGSQNLSNLVGNLASTCYRLCRFTSEKMQKYELDEDPIIVIDDDDNNDTSYYPVKMELERPEPSKFVEIEEPTTTATSHDDNFDLETLMFEDATFADLNEIIPIQIVQDENVSNLGNLARELDELSRIQNENAQLLQQLHDYENEKKLHTAQIAKLQSKLLALAQEKAALIENNATIAAKLEEVEQDRDLLREKNMKHICELMEHFREAKKAKLG